MPIIVLLTVAALLFAALSFARSRKDAFSALPPNQGNPDTRIREIAVAVARAEGFFLGGSLPNRANNPGALIGADGQVRFFDTEDAGWYALYEQIRIIVEGRSSYYQRDASIREIADTWTGGDNPGGWSRTVASYLGLSESTSWLEYVYG